MNRQRGNILFLILLAVVLFAALSYAVTQGMRGGGNDASKESNQNATADILNFLTLTRTSVDRMLTSGGYKPEQISFTHAYKSYDGTYAAGQDDNLLCTSDACRVFKPSGGGAAPRTFENYATANPTGIIAGNTMPGHYNILVMNFPFAGTSANDIVLGISAVKPAICDVIDANLGITATPITGGSFLRAQDTTQWDSGGYTVATNALQIAGKDIFDTRYGSGAGAACTLYQLLIAR